MSKNLKIPISAIVKIGGGTRPTWYKIVRTRPDIKEKIQKKEEELKEFYSKIFSSYKKQVYKTRKTVKTSVKSS